MVPYILLADDDLQIRDTFVKEYEKRVAYASVCTVDNGRSLVSFLSSRSWKDLPSIIILRAQLPDAKAPDVLRELLLDTRYMNIPKLVWCDTLQQREMEECSILGVKYYVKRPEGGFETEDMVRQINSILRSELFHVDH